MNLILLEEWMDHSKGTKLTLTDSFARTLLERGTAKEIIEEEEQRIKDNTNEKINRNHGNYNNFQIFILENLLFNYKDIQNSHYIRITKL